MWIEQYCLFSKIDRPIWFICQHASGLNLIQNKIYSTSLLHNFMFWFLTYVGLLLARQSNFKILLSILYIMTTQDTLSYLGILLVPNQWRKRSKKCRLYSERQHKYTLSFVGQVRLQLSIIYHELNCIRHFLSVFSYACDRIFKPRGNSENDRRNGTPRI